MSSIFHLTTAAWPVFAQGLLLSFGLIVAIGAQNAFVLRQGLRREHVGSVVLFCAAADALLIMAGVFGMAQALAGHLQGKALSRLQQDHYVWLDRFTIRNLELIGSPNGGKALIDVLDLTCSPMGSRLLKRWVVMPLKDAKPIDERLSVVEHLIKDPDLAHTLRLQIKQIGDYPKEPKWWKGVSSITSLSTGRTSATQDALIDTDSDDDDSSSVFVTRKMAPIHNTSNNSQILQSHSPIGRWKTKGKTLCT